MSNTRQECSIRTSGDEPWLSDSQAFSLPQQNVHGHIYRNVLAQNVLAVAIIVI